MTKARIKTYSKSEMAQLYERPIRTLMNWINSNSNLINELNKTGYRCTQKHFTPAQVEIIFKHLEAPYVDTPKEPAEK